MNKVKVQMVQKKNWAKATLFDHCNRTFPVPLDATIRKEGYFKTGLTLDEQNTLERKLGLSEGTLSPSSEYWRTFYVRLNSDIRTLDLDNPADYLDYKILQVNKRRIASSYADAKLNPEALYVLVNEEAEAIQKNSKRQEKSKAYVTFSNMTPNEMRKFLFLEGIKADNISDEIVREKIGDIIESKPEKFNKTFEDDQFESKVFIHTLKAYGILTVRKQQWYYNDTMLGLDEESTISWLKDASNQETLVILKRKLNEKKS